MTLHKSLASAVALAVLIPGAALAHHGWSSYDAEKTLTVTGPLTDVAWRNPHGEAKIKYDGKTWAGGAPTPDQPSQHVASSC